MANDAFIELLSHFSRLIKMSFTEHDWLCSNNLPGMLKHLGVEPGHNHLWSITRSGPDYKLRQWCAACNLHLHGLNERNLKDEDRRWYFTWTRGKAINEDDTWQPLRAAESWMKGLDKSPPVEVRCSLLRDVFGNPFRWLGHEEGKVNNQYVMRLYSQLPASAYLNKDDLKWGPVWSMAKEIFERQLWNEMPVLADLLEDTGVSDEDALNHCRDQEFIPAGGGEAGMLRRPVIHARGCWVIDLILGHDYMT